MKTKNTIKNIDIVKAVGIIREDIGYERRQCIEDNLAFATFLNEMDIPCKFEFGEAIYIPPEAWEKQYYRLVHRGFRVGMKPDEPAPFHFWLNVDGKVLDISIGAWTLDLPENYRREYIYGEYHNGFKLTGRFDRYDIGKVVTSTYCHSYNKFRPKKKVQPSIPNYDKYRTNKTMYEDLELGDWYRVTAQRYADQYRKLGSLLDK